MADWVLWEQSSGWQQWWCSLPVGLSPASGLLGSAPEQWGFNLCFLFFVYLYYFKMCLLIMSQVTCMFCSRSIFNLTIFFLTDVSIYFIVSLIPLCLSFISCILLVVCLCGSCSSSQSFHFQICLSLDVLHCFYFHFQVL